jgi:hypothetical protein
MTTAVAARQSGERAGGVFERFLPRQLDNAYRGRRLAIWLLVAVVLTRLAMGANSIVNTSFVATGPDAIPLSSYDPAAAQAVIGLFALLGLSHLLLALQGVVVLIRYRALVPLFYLLLLAHALGAQALLAWRPIAPAAAPGFGVSLSLVLLAATILGFGLSLSASASPSESVR